MRVGSQVSLGLSNGEVRADKYRAALDMYYSTVLFISNNCMESAFLAEVCTVLSAVLLPSCNTISPQGFYARPLFISYLFCDNLSFWFASQPHGSGTPRLSAFAKPSHFLLLNAILRLTFSSQLTPPASDPPSNMPWFFNRLRRYTSFVLTYLLVFVSYESWSC